METEAYYQCCGKSICRGCAYSCCKSGNVERCPFCNSKLGRTDEERVEELMKRVAANDAASINLLNDSYYKGLNGVQQDRAKAFELLTKSADLGNSEAHNRLGSTYHEGGYLKKAKFHFESAAMAGDEVARFNVGSLEANSGNVERAMKHWAIAASAGEYNAMHHFLSICFENGHVSRESINSTLAAYNASCAEMRSEARDAYIRMYTSNISAE